MIWSKIERRLARVLHQDTVDLGSVSSAVCFTFDDVPQSACIEGARIIEGCGGRATYYVCGGLDGIERGDRYFNTDDLSRLHANGHEIASHGFAHIDYQQHTLKEVVADLDRNDDYFAQSGLPAPRHFAFPFGSVSPRVKQHCAARFDTARGVENRSNACSTDRALLKAVHLYEGKVGRRQVEEMMTTAQGDPRLLVFMSHAVSQSPGEFDTTPAQLIHAARAAQERGLPILTMTQAWRHFTECRA